ncbi:MAG: putative sugar nucleotidyl transferase [Spirochaetes bacterium]|nr:putative sugar nucleotidyl transferase [Spirochaetota bacterium]
MHIVLYEDSFYPNFIPFYLFHNVFDLYYGFRRIYSKIIDIKRKNKNIKGVTFIGRKLQLEYFLEKTKLTNDIFEYEEDILFINSRITDINEAFKLKQREYIIDNDGFVIAIRVDKSSKRELNIKGLFSNEINANTISSNLIKINKVSSLAYSFDLIKNLNKEFFRDYERNYSDIKKHLKRIKKDIFVGKNCKISKFVDFDTKNGPIIISDNVTINSFTVICGPVYIGNGSLIDNAYIRENCVIGNICKISGEIEESYIMDYTNKHHEGFLGHSYLGEWVNIGAMTTTSDLKNNYSNIKFQIGNKTIDAGTIKMGALIGDHVKTAIGVMINCGTIIGAGSVIFKTPENKTIEPLRWGLEEYRKDIFIENTKKVMKRRDIEMSHSLISIIENL